MYAHFYAHMRWTSLPLFALCLFLTTFVAVVVRVFLASRRKEIDAAAQLPFDCYETTHPARSTEP
jgi:cbb3-type cytochrome oxidase subunit 3